MKNLLSSWKVKFSMVGGAIVIATAYGTCTVDPDEVAIKEIVEEKVLDKASEEPAKAEEPKEDVAEPVAK